MENSIETKKLDVGYDGVIIVSDFNCEIKKNKITSIIGANGCGKSTVLKAIGRIIRSDGGTIIINNQNMKDLKTKEIAKQMAILPQSPSAPGSLTVFELVADIDSLGSATTICAGGRYNNLVSYLGGPDTPGIGFASGVDRLIHILKELNQEKEIATGMDVYVMAVNEEERLTALRLVQDLRWCEVKTEMDMLDRGLKAQFKQADRLGARMLIILNSEDLQKGLITVKDNLTKEETKVDESEILDYIISNL